MAIWDVLANTFAPNELAAKQDRQKNALALELDKLKMGEAKSEIQRNNAYRNALADVLLSGQGNTPAPQSPQMTASLTGQPVNALATGAGTPQMTANDPRIAMIQADPERAAQFMQGQQAQMDKALSHVKTIGEIIKSVGGLDNFKRAYPVLSKMSPILQGIDVNQIMERDNKFAQPVKDGQGNVLGHFVFNPENGEATFEKAEKEKSMTPEQLTDISLHDPDPAKRQRAKETLDTLQKGKEDTTPNEYKDFRQAGIDKGWSKDKILTEWDKLQTNRMKQRIPEFTPGPTPDVAFSRRTGAYKPVGGPGDVTGENIIDKAANYKWYSDPGTQKLIRRTDSIIDQQGSLSEGIRLAKLVNNPAGTPMNKIKGKLAVAFGDSKRQLLDLATNLSAEEMQQVFGGQGGGEKFLTLAQSLNDPNLSVEQYINAMKEIKYLIYTRQKQNVAGTPLEKKWNALGKEIEADRPLTGGKGATVGSTVGKYKVEIVQ